MKKTIVSKRLGCEMSFWAPNGGGYLRIVSDDCPGTLGMQVCEHGELRGSTVWSTPESFKKDVRNWYRAYVRKELACK